MTDASNLSLLRKLKKPLPGTIEVTIFYIGILTIVGLFLWWL